MDKDIRQFICLVCKSKKINAAMLWIQGKQCRQQNFTEKFSKLITEQSFISLKGTLKSVNNHCYVCKPCLNLVINTYDGITQLQTGVEHSIKRQQQYRMMTVQAQSSSIHKSAIATDVNELLEGYGSKKISGLEVCSKVMGKGYRCDECGKSFTRSFSLRRHVKCHEVGDDKPYKCPRPGCNQVYKHHPSLQRHLKFHDRETLPFPCSYPGCGKAYQNNYELKCHYRHHTGVKPYVCTIDGCGKSFRLPGQYTMHRRKHNGEKPFKCTWEGCEAAYSNRGQLETHALTHRGQTFICDLCGKAFSYKVTMLIHHRKMHMNEKNFTCYEAGCGKAFLYKSQLTIHAKRHHRSLKRVEEQSKQVKAVHKKQYKYFPCSFKGCGFRFRNERYRHYHKNAVHGPYAKYSQELSEDNYVFPCLFEGCSKSFDSIKDLTQHVNKLHMCYPREKMCFVCGAAFESINLLEVHQKTVHEEISHLNQQKTCCNSYSFCQIEDNAFVCMSERCDQQFSSAVLLKQHIYTHYENPVYKCDFLKCKRTFFLEKTFNSHKVVHCDDKPYNCFVSDCKQQFKTQSDVMKHSIEHFGVYRCPIVSCEKSLMQWKSARYHLNKHKVKKSFVCQVCGMAFSSLSQWMRHRRSHTGERPFKCPMCHKQFADKSALTSHYYLHTGQKPYKCAVCNAGFHSSSTYKLHIKLHKKQDFHHCQETGCDKKFKDPRVLKLHKNVHATGRYLCPKCGKLFKWRMAKHKCSMNATPNSIDLYLTTTSIVKMNKEQVFSNSQTTMDQTLLGKTYDALGRLYDIKSLERKIPNAYQEPAPSSQFENCNQNNQTELHAERYKSKSLSIITPLLSSWQASNNQSNSRNQQPSALIKLQQIASLAKHKQ